MTSPKISTPFTVAVFGIVGFVLGLFSLRFLDVLFYTTKPIAFLDQWHILLFIALFAVSFSLIPAAAARSRPRRLALLVAVWICVTVLTGLLLSVLTATIHHRTLDIPAWLIPMGLLLIPIISGTVTVASRNCGDRDMSRVPNHSLHATAATPGN